MLSVVFTVLACLLYAGPSDAVRAKNIQCDSWGYARATCNLGLVGNYQIVGATVIKQDSSSACTYGRSYGFSGVNMWVDHGCRALFNVRACSTVKHIDCDHLDSTNIQTCNVPGATNVNHVYVKYLKSNQPCIPYRSFGASEGSVWVANGCSAQFLVCTDEGAGFRSVPLLEEKLREIYNQ